MRLVSVRGWVLCCAGAILACPGTLPASTGQDPAQHARSAIASAARAMGGAELIRNLGSVSREGRDTWVDTLQQRRPWVGPIILDKLPAGEHIDVRLFVDYRTPTFAKVQRFADRPEELFTQIDGMTPEGGFGKGQFQREPSFYSTSTVQDAAGARAAEIKRLPEALVRLALEHPDRLRFAGIRGDSGRDYEVVAISDPELGENLLYIDRQTHLPAKVEYTRDHPIYGDTTVETLFDDYRPAGALTLPYKMTYRVGRLPTHIFTYSKIDLDVPAPAELLSRPANFVKAIRDPEKPELRELGGGVYAIRGGYNVMFAVFDDYVLLSEAPVGEDFVLQCLALIEKVAPGKPIVAVASHFHADHIAGARTLVARGIQIVARPETIEYIRRAVAARKTIKPDLLSAHPAEPRFIPITDRKTFSDARQSVDVFDVSPGQHSEHLLVSYFRNAKAVHVADMWDVPAPDQAIAGNDSELLWKTIQALGFDVQLMIPVHGNPATRAQLENGLAIRARYLPGGGSRR